MAYSDGSLLNDKAGWGVVVYYRARALTKQGSLANSEVFDAEAMGAAQAIKTAEDIVKQDQRVKEAHFFLDNTSVVKGLLGEAPVSSQREFVEFQHAAMRMAPCKVLVSWVPGHKDIPGNEIADQLAKRGTELPPQLYRPHKTFVKGGKAQYPRTLLAH